jgi:hypothetical protein
VAIIIQETRKMEELHDVSNKTERLRETDQNGSRKERRSKWERKG